MSDYRERESIQLGRPQWASSEEDWILSLLRDAGERGVSREWLIFTARSTQCGRAIHSLEQRGYVIEHAKFRGQRYVTYILRQEPLKETPTTEDWYEQKFGHPRPTHKPVQPDAGPLFAGCSRD